MEQKPVKLLKGAEVFEADLVCGALEQEGILYFRKERGPGAMYCGGVMMGSDVYVSQQDVEAATEIMEGLLKAELLPKEE